MGGVVTLALLAATVGAPPELTQGRRALAEGRVDDAEALFRKALTAEPGNIPAHIELSKIARRSGRFGEALEHVLRAEMYAGRGDRRPRRERALIAIHRERAQARAARARHPKRPRLPPRPTREDGDEALREGRLYDAGWIYSSVLHREGATAELLLGISRLLELQGDLPAAESQARMALALAESGDPRPGEVLDRLLALQSKPRRPRYVTTDDHRFWNTGRATRQRVITSRGLAPPEPERFRGWVLEIGAEPDPRAPPTLGRNRSTDWQQWPPHPLMRTSPRFHDEQLHRYGPPE